MTDRPYMISVDLGPVATAALKELVEGAPKRTQSDIIRDCIVIVHQFSLLQKLADQAQRAINVKATVTPAKKKRKASDEEKQVVEVYKEVYDYDGRIYWPPALSTIRAARSNGLSYDVIKEIVRVSINDPWLGQQMARGDRPQLHQILSEKVIATLLPKAERSAEEEADQALLKLNGEIKPQALQDLKGVLSPELYSKAWDEINSAMNEREVQNIVRAAMEGTLAKYLDEHHRFIEEVEGLDV